MTIFSAFITYTHSEKQWYSLLQLFTNSSKTCVKLSLSKIPQIGFQDQLSLKAVKSIANVCERQRIYTVCLKMV